MSPEQQAERSLRHGEKFPFDAPESWWNEPSGKASPPPATDWAHAAARGVLADLQDRRGIKRGFEDLDEEVRVDIVSALAAIIRAARGDAEGSAG